MTDEMTVQTKSSVTPMVVGGVLGAGAGAGATFINPVKKWTGAPKYSNWEQVVQDINKDDKFESVIKDAGIDDTKKEEIRKAVKDVAEKEKEYDRLWQEAQDANEKGVAQTSEGLEKAKQDLAKAQEELANAQKAVEAEKAKESAPVETQKEGGVENKEKVSDTKSTEVKSNSTEMTPDKTQNKAVSTTAKQTSQKSPVQKEKVFNLWRDGNQEFIQKISEEIKHGDNEEYNKLYREAMDNEGLSSNPQRLDELQKSRYKKTELLQKYKKAEELLSKDYMPDFSEQQKESFRRVAAIFDELGKKGIDIDTINKLGEWHISDLRNFYKNNGIDVTMLNDEALRRMTINIECNIQKAEGKGTNSKVKPVASENISERAIVSEESIPVKNTAKVSTDAVDIKALEEKVADAQKAVEVENAKLSKVEPKTAEALKEAFEQKNGTRESFVNRESINKFQEDFKKLYEGKKSWGKVTAIIAGGLVVGSIIGSFFRSKNNDIA